MRVLIVALALVVPFFLGFNAPVMFGGMSETAAAVPDWRVAFNSDGVNSTDGISPWATCTDHGATGNQTGHDCSYEAGTGEPEGDGTYRVDGTTATLNVVFDPSSITPQSTFWVQLDFKADYADTGSESIVAFTLAGAGTGWGFRTNTSPDEIVMICNGVDDTEVFSPTAGVWYQLRFEMNGTTSVGEMWVDGTSRSTCDEADASDTFDSLLFTDAMNTHDAYEVDDVQIFLSDPGW